MKRSPFFGKIGGEERTGNLFLSKTCDYVVVWQTGSVRLTMSFSEISRIWLAHLYKLQTNQAPLS